MTRKTSYTLREVANMLGLDIRIARLHADRGILKTEKKLSFGERGYLTRQDTRTVKIKRRKRIVRFVSLAAFSKYKKYIRLKYKPRN